MKLIFIALVFICFSLSFSTSAMDPPLLSVDFDLVRRFLKQTQADKEIDVFEFAKDQCDKQVERLTKRKEFLETSQPELIQSKLKLADLKDLRDRLAEILDIQSFEDLRLSETRTRKPIKFTLSRSIKNAIPAIDSQLLAWSIIKRSLEYAKDNSVDLGMLVHELLRLGATATVNYIGVNKSEPKEFWHEDLRGTEIVLSCVLIAIEFNLSKFSESTHYQVYIDDARKAGKSEWHLVRFLVECNKTGKYLPDVLRFTEDDLEHAKSLDTAPGQTKNDLRNTNLFQILDVNAREKFNKEDLKKLENYHFYVGTDVVDFVRPNIASSSEVMVVAKNDFSQQIKKDKKAQPSKKQKSKKQKKRVVSSSHSPKDAVQEERDEHLEQTICPPKQLHETAKEKESVREEVKEDCAGRCLENSYINALLNLPAPIDKIDLTPSSAFINVIPIKHMCGDKELCLPLFINSTQQIPASYMFENNKFNVAEHFEHLAENLLKKEENENNILNFFITIHGVTDGETFAKTFFPQTRPYISGVQSKSTKSTYRGIHAVMKKHSFRPNVSLKISDVKWEAKMYFSGVFSKKCSEVVIERKNGIWTNALHTEVFLGIDLYLLYLKEIIKELYAAHPNFTLTGVVLGLQSHFTVCEGCQRFLQGMQWNLPRRLFEIIQEIDQGSNQIKLSSNFSTLVLTRAKVHTKDLDLYRYKPVDIGAKVPVLGAANSPSPHRLIMSIPPLPKKTK